MLWFRRLCHEFIQTQPPYNCFSHFLHINNANPHFLLNCSFKHYLVKWVHTSQKCKGTWSSVYNTKSGIGSMNICLSHAVVQIKGTSGVLEGSFLFTDDLADTIMFATVFTNVFIPVTWGELPSFHHWRKQGASGELSSSGFLWGNASQTAWCQSVSTGSTKGLRPLCNICRVCIWHFSWNNAHGGLRGRSFCRALAVLEQIQLLLLNWWSSPTISSTLLRLW